MKKLILAALVLLASSFLSGIASADLNDGLVAYYPFNGNAEDATENGNDGTVYGATPSSGILGQGMNFVAESDLSGDYVEILHNDTFNISNFTISLWINANAIHPTVYSYLLTKGNAKDWKDYSYLLQVIPSGQVKLIVGGGGIFTNYFSVQSLTSVEINTWYHVVGIYDNGVLKVYLNGILEASNSTAIIPLNNFGPLRIGISGNNTYPFTGKMDEIRIYNRALTETEIQDLYGQVSTNGLIAYYPFDGNAYDASGNGNNGDDSNGGGYVSGIIGQAASFDGITSQIVVSDSLLFDCLTGVGDFSINLWVNFRSYQSDIHSTFIEQYESFLNRWHWYYKDNSIKYGYHDDVQWNAITPVPWIPELNKWYNLTIVRANRIFGVYVDAQLLSSGPFMTGESIVSPSAPIRIGFMEMENQGFDGNIDDIRIYNRALSQAEIQELSIQGLNSGLIAYYPFDGNVKDASVNANDGFDYGVAYVTGIMGQAASFDGIDDFVRVPSTLKLQYPLTVSLWVKPSEQGMTFWSSDNRVASAMTYNYPNMQDRFGFFILTSDNPYSGFAASFPSTVDEWHHVVWLYDGAMLKGYVDGVEAVSVPRTGALLYGQYDDSTIGSYCSGAPCGSQNPFKGSVDEARIYNRALSTDEIWEIYSAGATPQLPTLQVLEPNGGGDPLIKGNTYSIRWAWSNYTGSVRIELNNDYNNTFLLLYPSEPVENGTQGVTFSIPEDFPSGNKYRIVITMLGTENADFSDNYFTVQSSGTTRAVYHLVLTNWAQQYKPSWEANPETWATNDPYIYQHDRNADGTMENYYFGCAAVAVGQLINYYLEQHRIGWLEQMLANTTVSPTFSLIALRGNKLIWDTIDIPMEDGYTTKNNYVKEIESRDAGGADDLRTFLWNVALGLDSNFTELNQNKKGEFSGSTSVVVSSENFDLLPRLLRERFRFHPIARHFGGIATKDLGTLAKDFIIQNLNAGQPLLVALYPSDHWALIDGYEELSDGKFNIYMNFGRGNLCGENDIAYNATAQAIQTPSGTYCGGVKYKGIHLFQNLVPINVTPVIY